MSLPRCFRSPLVLGLCITLGWGGMSVAGEPQSADVAANSPSALEKACEEGNLKSCAKLGTLHVKGEGVEKDERRAASLFEKACEVGDTTGCLRLGVFALNGRGMEKDERRATSLFEKACQAGDAGGCYNLGLFAEAGLGGEKDEHRAAARYAEACEKGEASGCFSVGDFYMRGRGVDRDDAEAVYWFRKAAEQGHEDAMLQLADMLKRGAGAERDPKAAEALYRRAAEKGNERARLRLASFAREQTCMKKARTALFESLLRCVGREDFRVAIKRGGARAVREDNDYWYDEYESEDVLQGSRTLSVGYTRATGEFAVAEYTFPSHVDPEQIGRIRDMVVSKYGAPAKSSGNTRLGPASYEWSLPDGIRMRVYRNWPDTTTFLEYVRPDTRAVLDGELKKNKNEQRARELKKQSSAF